MKESELERIEYTDFGLGAIETVQSIGTLLEMTMKENENLSLSKGSGIPYVEGKETKTFLYYSKKERKLLYSKKKLFFMLEISTRSSPISNTSSRQAQQVRLSLNFLPAVTIQVIFLQIQLFIVNKRF